MYPDTAIIVPIYHTEKYLEKCIRSILAQDSDQYVLILVDDGSDDGCSEICDRYASAYEQIHVIHKPNGGISDARNAGIEWALMHEEIRWIAYVDSDDHLRKNYLSALQDLAELCQVRCAVSGLAFDFDNAPEEDDEAADDTKNFVISSDMAYRYPYYTNAHPYSLTCVIGKLFDIALFRDVRFPVGRLMEDRFITHRLLFQCEKIAITTRSLYRYYQSPNSIMRSAWKPERLDMFDAFREELLYYQRNRHPHALWQSLNEGLEVLNGEMDSICKSVWVKPYYARAVRKYIQIVIRHRKNIKISTFFQHKYHRHLPVLRWYRPKSKTQKNNTPTSD